MQMKRVNGIICSVSNPLGNRQFSSSSSGKIGDPREKSTSFSLSAVPFISSNTSPQRIPRGARGAGLLTLCCFPKGLADHGLPCNHGELPSREASKLTSGLKTRESEFLFFNLHKYTMLFLFYQQWIIVLGS